MSIYSGFGLRKMEEQYNKLVARLILLLQSDAMELMSPPLKHKNTQYGIQILRKKKLTDYKSVLEKLELFEQHKYLQPKFSQLCVPLKNYLRHTDFKLSINPVNIENKLISEKNQNQRQNGKQIKQKFQSQDTAFYQNFLSQSSIKKFNQTMSQFGKKNQSKFQQFTDRNIKTENGFVKEQFSIFTIQEVSENISRKQSLQKNKKVMLIQDGNFKQKMRERKVRIYKSNQKYVSPCKSQVSNNEPFFPSYRKLSHTNRTQSEQMRNLSLCAIKNQKFCEENEAKIQQFQTTPSETLNLEMSQSFTQMHGQSFKQIKSNIMKKGNPTKKVQKSTHFVNMRYKKLIDRTDLAKFLSQKNSTYLDKNNKIKK